MLGFGHALNLSASLLHDLAKAVRRAYNPRHSRVGHGRAARAHGGRNGKAARVVVVGDAQAVALEGRRRPRAVRLRAHVRPRRERGRARALRRATASSWSPGTRRPRCPPRACSQLLGARPAAPPIVVYGEAFTEDEIVELHARRRARLPAPRRPARVCAPRSSARRPTAVARRSRAEADAGDRYRALIEEIPALTYVAWADESGSRAYVSPQLLAMTGFSPGEWLAEPDMWVQAPAPGGPRAGAAPVPRRLRQRGALRLGVPPARPRGPRRVVARRGPSAAGAGRRGPLRARVRARHHRAEARRGVAAPAALLRPAHRACRTACCCCAGSAVRSPSRRADRPAARRC